MGRCWQVRTGVGEGILNEISLRGPDVRKQRVWREPQAVLSDPDLSSGTAWPLRPAFPSAWNILRVVALLVFHVSAEKVSFFWEGCMCVWVCAYDEGSGVQGRSIRSQGLVICNPTTVQLLCCHRFLLAPNSPTVLLAVSGSRVLWPG